MSDLTEITGIAGATASSLNEIGIETTQDLAKADPSDVEGVAPHLNGQDVVNEANQNSIIVQTGEEAAQEMKDKTYITSGIDGLDRILDGGFEEGMTCGIYGQSGEGKSQIAMHSLVAAVEANGMPTLYLETEQDNYRPERIQTFAEDPTSQHHVHKIGGIEDLTDQRNAYEAIHDHFEADTLGMVVIDSFNAHFRDEYPERQNLSDRATVMKEHLKRLNRLAKTHRVPILLLLQSYGTPEAWGKQDTPYGGNVMIHNIGYFLRMSNGTGDLTEASLWNHPGLPDKGVLLNINETGIEYKKDS